MTPFKNISAFTLNVLLLVSNYFCLNVIASSRSKYPPAFFGELPRQVAQKVHPSVALVSPMGVRNITAQGSGFVVEFGQEEEDDGHLYVLTAAHVASPGKRIQVSFPCSSNQESQENNIMISYPASVVGRDLSADLALIRLKREEANFPSPLRLSNTVAEVGQLAFAHGYPARLDGVAMTCGIVCGAAKGLGLEAIDKSAERKTTPTSYVVTDAAMAGGMSGGPLVDIDGVVLGVNALVRPDLGALGNYAVAASECTKFLTSLTRDLSDGGISSGISGYRVVIFNDPMNTRARVAQVLGDVAKLGAEEAEQSMLTAHTTGWGVVRLFPGNLGGRVEAEKLCEDIRNEDILAEVLPVRKQENEKVIFV